MKEKIMTFLFFLLTNAIQKVNLNPGSFKKITELQLTVYYLKIIKTCRLLFISSLSLGLSFVLILSSFILFHVAFFIYAPFNNEVKMWTGFIFAASYLLTAAKILNSVFAEKSWLKTFAVPDLLNSKAEATPEQTT